MMKNSKRRWIWTKPFNDGERHLELWYGEKLIGHVHQFDGGGWQYEPAAFSDNRSGIILNYKSKKDAKLALIEQAKRFGVIGPPATKTKSFDSQNKNDDTYFVVFNTSTIDNTDNKVAEFDSFEAAEKFYNYISLVSGIEVKLMNKVTFDSEYKNNPNLGKVFHISYGAPGMRPCGD